MVPSNAPPSTMQPGYRLDGRYELLCRWAQGGMAAVWLARVRGKHGFEKLFAVKTILPHLARDESFRRMFLDEARIAAQIRHPNVAGIEDLGEDRGILYMVFEWVQGDPWSKLIAAVRESGRPLPTDVMLRIAASACAGLDGAHELRSATGQRLDVVHRDVSPQNILVTERGETKVIDFGIAKAADRLSEETRTGLIKGKLEYAAPEQVRRQPVDRRTDVWAIGAILYEIFSGRVPYEGSSDLEKLRKIASGKPPARLGGSTPPSLAEAVATALQPDPARRFATAADLQRALEAAMSAATGVEDVARCVQAYLPERIAERRADIRAALAEAATRNGERQPSLHEIVPEASPGGASALSPEAALGGGAPSLDAVRPASAVATAPARWPRWLLPALLASTVLVVAVWGRVLARAWEIRHGLG